MKFDWTALTVSIFLSTLITHDPYALLVLIPFMYVAAWIGTSSVDKSFKKKNSKNADFEKCKFSNQQSKSNQTKEDVSVSNWMTEAQRKEFEALAKNK